MADKLVENKSTLTPILPGQALGVMGGGQLGRMFVHAAQRLGYRTVVLDADAQSPAGRVSHGHICTAYGDAAGLAELAASAAAVTTEFENVPSSSLKALEQSVPVRPSAAAVAVCQDRALEKAYFLKAGVACAPHATITSVADCAAVALDLLPGILKTAQLGYDGKGQITVHDVAGLQQAFSALGGVRCLLEKRLDLDFEISVIVARGADGTCVHLPAQQNLHRNGILAVSIIPAIKLPLVSAQYAYGAAIITLACCASSFLCCKTAAWWPTSWHRARTTAAITALKRAT
jgi:5-(carboxyamino)imidazole ribonucleotide synthase